MQSAPTSEGVARVSEGKVLASFLYDDFAVRTQGPTPWRRARPVEVMNAIRGRANAFTKSSAIFANKFKVFSLFAPSAFADSLWVFNNPHLFYLSTLDRTSPNNIQPALRDPEFLELYWRPDRRRRSFSEIFHSTYPDVGDGLDDASWLMDSFKMFRDGFERDIRWRFVDKFLADPLAALNARRVELATGPKNLMRENMVFLLENCRALLAEKGIASDEQHTAREVLETLGREMYESSTPGYSHGRALNRIPKLADGSLAEKLSWTLTDHVYLRAYATANSGGSAGYGPGVLAIGEVVEPPEIRLAESAVTQLEDLLSELSFSTIFSEAIRHSGHFARYRQSLAELSTITRSRDRDVALRDAVTTLLGGIGPAIYRATGNKVFSDRSVRAGASWAVAEQMAYLALAAGEVLLPIVKPIVDLAKQLPVVEGWIDNQAVKARYLKGRRIVKQMRGTLGVNLTRERAGM